MNVQVPVNLKNLAEVIYAWRRFNDLSVLKAAERIGVDRAALYRLERCEHVNQAALVKIGRWLIG
jgi:transcriptional regulator with XRE-family HTH domain